MSRNESAPVLRAFLILLALLGFSGCVTSRPYVPENPLALLGNGASYYLVFPVEPNSALLDLYASKRENKKDLLRAIARTQTVYAGVYQKVGGGYSVRFLASGSFPARFAKALFQTSKGWTEIHADGAGIWYHSAAVDVALPRNGLVCGSSGDGIESLLRNLKNGNVPVMQISPEFSAYASSALADGRIALYVSEPESIVKLVLGPDVTLPVKYAEIYAKPSGTADYEVSARIALADARSARAMQSLLRLVLANAETRLENDDLYLTGYRISNEKLVEFLGSLYFNK